MAGNLFIFEGPDGVGKTTLVDNTINFLRARNSPLLSLSSPGKTAGTLGHLVDRIHHTPADYSIKEIAPLALQALHIGAHLDAIENRIKPALDENITVLLDRTWWSTWVYGLAANVNVAVLSKLIEAEQLAWGGIVPAAVFLVQRAAAVRVEHSQEAFNTLSHLYEDLAAREEARYPVIRILNDDLNLSTDLVRELIAPILGLDPQTGY